MSMWSSVDFFHLCNVTSADAPEHMNGRETLWLLAASRVVKHQGYWETLQTLLSKERE